MDQEWPRPAKILPTRSVVWKTERSSTGIQSRRLQDTTSDSMPGKTAMVTK